MVTEPPRGTGTRQVLLDAALQVFLQHGFARATTREIAQTAGVAEGTIYRHFADKYELFHEVFLSLTSTSWPSCSGSASEPAGHGTRQPGVPLQARRRHPGEAVVADGVDVGRSGAGQERRRPRTRRWPRRASCRRGLWRWWPSTSARSRSSAGSGLTSTRGRPRPSWSRCRSRPGWSARSAHIRTPTGEFPVPDDFPVPAAAALDILARGLAPAPGAVLLRRRRRRR